MITTTTTIHAEAMALLGMARAEYPTMRPSKALLRRIVRDAIAMAWEKNTRHLERDWRPGIGSGRAAHWDLVIFRRMQSAAQTLLRATSLRGRALGSAALMLALSSRDRLSPELEQYYPTCEKNWSN